MNAVYVVGNMLGPSMYYGSGAGSLPTASAVVGDLVYMARHAKYPSAIRWSEDKVVLAGSHEKAYQNFLRTSLTETEIRGVFPVAELVDAGIGGELGLITEPMTEQEYQNAAAQLVGNALIQRLRLA